MTNSHDDIRAERGKYLSGYNEVIDCFGPFCCKFLMYVEAYQ